jgi:hypothetical protein
LGIVGFTPLRFDASASTGEGLSYVIEFGDGQTSTAPVSSHVSGNPAELRRGRVQSARLTIVDRLGRSAAVSVPYFIAAVKTVDFWHGREGQLGHHVYLDQDGDRLTGTYRGPDNRLPEPVARLSGTLSDERTVHLRSADGAFEFTGSLEWRDGVPSLLGQGRVVLRLKLGGSRGTGKTIDFEWVDAY